MTVHYAQTLDGRIAARDGSSRWISGEESLRFAHELRAAHDAVVVGVGTVLADDPQLTVRLVPGRSPLRVVVDSTLRIPLDARVVTDGAAPTLVATTPQAPAERVATLRARGVSVELLPPDSDEHVDVHALLAALEARGISSVLVEGGRSLITAMLRAGVVARLVVCVAPKLLGEGIAAIGDIGASRLDDAVRLGDVTITRCGADLIID